MVWGWWAWLTYVFSVFVNVANDRGVICGLVSLGRDSVASRRMAKMGAVNDCGMRIANLRNRGHVGCYEVIITGRRP